MSGYARTPPDKSEKRYAWVMEFLQDFQKQLLNMHWSDYLDIILVAYLIYRAMLLIRSTSAMRIARAIVALLVVAWGTQLLKLKTLSFLINQVMAVGLVAVVVLFQPELRRMLDRLGSVSLKKLLGTTEEVAKIDHIISQTVQACEVMSRERIGALIVFTREQRLDEYFKTGTTINGLVSEQLIRNIFFPKAALHDGAMIIQDGLVAAAGCVLPLSDSNRLSADLGTRHRAGVGMSEATDAVVIIVSEETGTISVAVGGMLKRHLAPQTLEKLLHNELTKLEEDSAQTNPLLRLKKKLMKKEGADDEKQ